MTEDTPTAPVEFLHPWKGHAVGDVVSLPVPGAKKLCTEDRRPDAHGPGKSPVAKYAGQGEPPWEISE